MVLSVIMKLIWEPKLNLFRSSQFIVCMSTELQEGQEQADNGHSGRSVTQNFPLFWYQKGREWWRSKAYLIRISRMGLSTKTFAVWAVTVSGICYVCIVWYRALQGGFSSSKRVVLTGEQTPSLSQNAASGLGVASFPKTWVFHVCFNAQSGWAKSVYLICEGQKCTGFCLTWLLILYVVCIVWQSFHRVNSLKYEFL